ncbi:MAG: pyridoxamine 5'-phosphate oxidase family protein, partial [Selenomonas sp.]|nr:pyridoxamine 5'-phosphate oxidase family protein [Selenomonas sp.]
YTTYFRSVIAFGRIRILTDDSEHRAAIEALAEKFAPDYPEGRNAEINKLYTAFLMLEMRIEHMTGKQAKELVKA